MKMQTINRKSMAPMLAILIGVGGAFATTAKTFSSPATYINGEACESGNTVESDCDASNAGQQCKVAVSGTPSAWQPATSEIAACTVPLKRVNP